MISFRSLLVVLAAAGLPLASGCSGINPDEVLPLQCPPGPGEEESFRLVSQVVENRCGTLDCHGNTERPMRIYGRWALRKPQGPGDEYYGNANYVPGGLETTAAELTDNAAAICGLEPVKTANVAAGLAVTDTLTFVRKPRLQESHKGGRIWDPGSNGDKCMTSWLISRVYGRVDEASCNSELGLQ